MSTASNPARLRISAEKFSIARPRRSFPVRFLSDLLGIPLRSEMITQEDYEEMLRDGDARAAVVVSTSPTTVAAYSDEFDAVILLRIPESQCYNGNLTSESRLIAVFNYFGGIGTTSRDIQPGDCSTGQFINAEPLIGNFLSDDVERLTELQQSIPESEWQRAAELGHAALATRPNLYRLHHPGSTREVAGDMWIAIAVAVFLVLGLVVALWKFA